jgi:hypothetical protein
MIVLIRPAASSSVDNAPLAGVVTPASASTDYQQDAAAGVQWAPKRKTTKESATKEAANKKDRPKAWNPRATPYTWGMAHAIARLA